MKEEFKRESKRAIEAILMVASHPVSSKELAEILETSPKDVEALIEELSDEYKENGRGFELVKIADGYRYQSRSELYAYVEKFIMEDSPAKLSAAALETLAIIAYRQPVSRAQLSAIRGVNVESVLRLLVERGYVDAVGRDSGPGQAMLYGTTELFLEKLGLASISDLPDLAQFVPDPSLVETLERVLNPEIDA
jgi:segregation and condensation protein B